MASIRASGARVPKVVLLVESSERPVGNYSRELQTMPITVALGRFIGNREGWRSMAVLKTLDADGIILRDAD